MVKQGFSLAEALVVMAIISILFAAVAKVITTRPEKPKQTNMHGYFECYVDGGLKQRYVRNGASTPLESVAQCHFEPISGVAFYNINSFKRGTTPTSVDNTVTPPIVLDDDGIYYSHFEPNISTELSITKTANSFRISSSNGRSMDLGDNAKRSEQELFFKSLYSDTNMYNGGTIRDGVLISW